MSARPARGPARGAPRRAAPVPDRPRRSGTPAPPLTLRHPAAWLALLAIAGAIAWLVTHHIADPDLWQHLRVGRTIWETRGIPRTHLWTWPNLGQPEVLPSWLFRALLWPFWSAAGEWGLQAWRWLTTLGAFAILALVARRLGTRGLVPWLAFVLAALTYRQRSEVRPETLAALLFVTALWLLERGRSGDRRAAWGLPLVALAWVNAHVSWWMGFALIAIFAAESWVRERTPPRTLLLAAAVALAASFVNPFGWRALWQPFEYQFTLRDDPLFRTIAELKPVDWHDNRWNGLPLLVAGWPLLALLRARRGSDAQRGPGLDGVELMLLAVFGGLGLTTQRFLGFFALAAAPYVARDLSQVLAGWRGPVLAPWPRAIAVAAAAAALVAVERSHSDLAAGPGVDTRFLPVAACDYIERAGVRGNGLNEFWQGGYLVWRFWPQRDRLPFMDIHQTGSAEDRARMAQLGERRGALQALDRRHHFEWVLCSNRVQLSGELANELDADSSWVLAFTDDAALLYLRRHGALAAIAERDGYRWLAGGQDALRALGRRVAADPGVRPAVRAELQRAIHASPARSGVAQNLLASLAMVEGRFTEAVARFDSSRATGTVIVGLEERRRQALGLAGAR